MSIYWRRGCWSCDWVGEGSGEAPDDCPECGREMARVQSFPDWFEFTGPRTSGGERRQEVNCQTEQVGNAVPPLLMEKIAGHVRQLLEESNEQ